LNEFLKFLSDAHKTKFSRDQPSTNDNNKKHPSNNITR